MSSTRHSPYDSSNVWGYSTQSVEIKNTPMIYTSNGIEISEQLLSYFLLINFWGPGQCVSILGMIVNILNVITFVKQGVRDSVNISLLGLTISDLGSLVFLFFLNLCWTPSISRADLPFYPQQFSYFLFYGHLIFTRVTTGTTAWIAFERCLCIVVPLKIKSIVTPRRTVAFIVILYIFIMAAVSPIVYTSRLVWIFNVARNRTVIVMTKIPNRGQIENVSFWINNILPVIFFVFIVMCTIILVRTLHKNALWRKQMMSTTVANDKSTRDTKVMKMVLIISIVFIFCYAPLAASFIWVIIDPEIKIDGKQKDFMTVVFSVLLHLESINATANFFIYIRMSSKVKATFLEIFCLPVYRQSCTKSSKTE